MKTAKNPKNRSLWEKESNPPPRLKLDVEAKRFYKKILGEYQISDAGGLLILRTACEALTRMKEAQAVLAAEGLTVLDRFGQPRGHPAAIIERDSRAAMLAALKALNLDLEPLQGLGRPPGRR